MWEGAKSMCCSALIQTSLYPILLVISHQDTCTRKKSAIDNLKVSPFYSTYMPYYQMLQKAVLPHQSPHHTFATHVFAYRPNWCTKDDTAIVLHTALSHLEHWENYVRMLFINNRSDIYPIIMDILVSKLPDLGLNPLSSAEIKYLFTNHPQTVKHCPYFSSTHLLHTGSLQGWGVKNYLLPYLHEEHI